MSDHRRGSRSYSEISNAANAFSTKHTGNIVGLRAKTKGVKYSNITVKKASELNVKFYAENGGEAIESKSFGYGKAMGTLPVATREGFDFAGWYYTDYMWPWTAPIVETQKNPNLTKRSGWAY